MDRPRPWSEACQRHPPPAHQVAGAAAAPLRSGGHALTSPSVLLRCAQGRVARAVKYLAFIVNEFPALRWHTRGIAHRHKEMRQRDSAVSPWLVRRVPARAETRTAPRPRAVSESCRGRVARRLPAVEAEALVAWPCLRRVVEHLGARTSRTYATASGDDTGDQRDGQCTVGDAGGGDVGALGGRTGRHAHDVVRAEGHSR